MLFKKMIRDIKKYKIQFISIFLMAFLGVYFFAGICSEEKGLEEASNKLYKDTNIADVWLYGNNFSNSDTNKLKNMKNTNEVEKQLVLSTKGKLKNDPEITAHFIEKGKISKPYIVEGEKFDINSENGIWLDKRFADSRKLNIGDDISLKINGYEITKKIKGLIYSSEYIYQPSNDEIIPNFHEKGFAYLSYKAFPTSNISYNTIILKTDSKNIENYEYNINKTLTNSYSVFLSKKDHISVKQFQEEINQHKMMGDIFPVLFLLISFLTLMTTMTRIVNTQRTQIGILKANGFKNKTILLHYLSYGFWLTLIGSIIGLIVGPLTVPYLFYPSMSSFYTLPYWKPSFNLRSIILAFSVMLLSTIITYFSIKKITKEDPVSSIRPKTPNKNKKGFIEKTRFWKKISFNLKWNIKDIKRNKIRSLMTIIGILGCSALIISALSMHSSMNDLKNWKYEDISQYNSILSVKDNITSTQIQKVVEKTNGEVIQESTIEIMSKNVKKTGKLTVTNNTTLITPTNRNREPISLPSTGISISYKMADMLKVKKGDYIKWKVYGNNTWEKSKIVAIYSDPTSQGIIMPLKTYEKYGYNFTPTSILSPNFEIQGGFEGINNIKNKSTLIKNWDELTESFKTMVYIMIFFALLLSIVVLYNLNLLSFTESEREIAILKVMGFKSLMIRKILLTQNIWFTSIGFLLGIPVGFAFFYMMITSSGESFDFPLNIHISNLIITFIIMFTVSIFVNLVFSRKVNEIDMVESLKK